MYTDGETETEAAGKRGRRSIFRQRHTRRERRELIRGPEVKKRVRCRKSRKLKDESQPVLFFGVTLEQIETEIKPNRLDIWSIHRRPSDVQ